MSDKKFFLSSSPHFTAKLSTQKIMLAVIIALLPEVVYACVLFGLSALIRILVSVVACVGFEALFQLITKQKIRVYNLSAIVSGIMLALVCTSTVPIWQLILGDAIAMIVAKGLFGGIGSNVFNPALTGRAFMFISFPAAMGASWALPHSDVVSSATLLSSAKAGTLVIDNQLIKDLFFGNVAGCMGETSALLILISFLFLLILGIIDWRAPLAMVATVTVCTLIAGDNVLFALLSGGLLFGATFMVTDYATTPVTKGGRLVFGFGCGLITFLIRKFGGYPEGVMFSILIMNAVAPFLNNITYRKYGYGKKGNKKPKNPKIVMDFDVKNAKEETK